MIRYTLLTTAILFLAAYAWRDWYKVLCALIVMMAFVEHPDMPKEMFGIPGMNPWNVLLLAVLASWLGMLPATVLFVYAGSLARVAAAETTLARKALHGVGLLATVVVAVWIARIARRALAGKLAPPAG